MDIWISVMKCLIYFIINTKSRNICLNVQSSQSTNQIQIRRTLASGQVLLWRNYINSSQHLGITINCARSVGAEIPSYHFILSVLTKSK